MADPRLERDPGRGVRGRAPAWCGSRRPVRPCPVSRRIFFASPPYPDRDRLRHQRHHAEDPRQRPAPVPNAWMASAAATAKSRTAKSRTAKSRTAKSRTAKSRTAIARAPGTAVAGPTRRVPTRARRTWREGRPRRAGGRRCLCRPKFPLRSRIASMSFIRACPPAAPAKLRISASAARSARTAVESR